MQCTARLKRKARGKDHRSHPGKAKTTSTVLGDSQIYVYINIIYILYIYILYLFYHIHIYIYLFIYLLYHIVPNQIFLCVYIHPEISIDDGASLRCHVAGAGCTCAKQMPPACSPAA
jgi:hypothetical protein